MYLIVGSGPMAREYVKPLIGLNAEFVVVGRGADSCTEFELQMKLPAISGGIDKFLEENDKEISGVIVAVGVEALYEVVMKLLNKNVKNILVEKPAGINLEEIEHIATTAKETDSRVFVAYNRRFFSSVLKANEIIEQEGGVVSFNFELTEWGHVIGPLSKLPSVKEAWFLANTTHVADLAFFLGGAPQQLASFVNTALDWHPTGSNFSGAGISDKGALFSYSGNWQAPGRWAVEVLTASSRLIFRPMEQLAVQKLGSVNQEQVVIDDSLDKQYKPGLYLQTKAFLQGEEKYMCSIYEHLENSRHYIKMAGY